MNKTIRNIVFFFGFCGGAICMWNVGIYYTHERTCSVCNDKTHVEHCKKLSYAEKGKFDREHGCNYFWCSHYNGK